MDDVNINKIYLDIEEVELDGEEKEWIKLSWTSSQGENNDGNSQSPEIQRDSDNETARTKDCDDKVSFTNAEPEDISDGISVITESDTDAVNTNLFQICQFKPVKSPQRRLEAHISRQKDIWNILIACVIGIIIGLALSHFFIIPETCPVSDGVDAESLRTASRNILNIRKELTDVKTMLNEIKVHIPADKKIKKQFLAEFFEITDSSNKSSKFITKKIFNSTSHPLDQLEGALHILSSLALIHDNNDSLKNEINKTLDIVNNTKVFYNTLFANNTQDVFNPIVLNSLQHSSDKMHITSKLLLSDLVQKVNKVTSKVYDKYAKERHRLNKKLCHLKNMLPDDKFLKQLTENNQLFKDYDKSCFSNYTKNLDDKMITKGNTEKQESKGSIKEQITKTDNTESYAKYDEKTIYRTGDNNREKNNRNKKQNVNRSAMKFLRNTSHKIYNASQLLFSEVVENIKKLRRQLSKKLHYLKNILPNNNEVLKVLQLIEDDEEDNKERNEEDNKKVKYLLQLTKDDEEDKERDEEDNKKVKYREENNPIEILVNNYFQSSTILKTATSKNNFDDYIFMQLTNTCSRFIVSTNFCPQINFNMSTFEHVLSKIKIKNYKQKEHNIKSIMDGISARILPTEEESRSKKKDYFKSYDSSKNVIKDKANYEGKKTSSQNEIKNTLSELIVNFNKRSSSFNSYAMRRDNQYSINADGRSNKRSHEYKKQRQFDNSDWYFRRAFSRRNARRRNARAKYIYQDTTWFWKNHR